MIKNKLYSLAYRDEDWIRENKDENLDWTTISEKIPEWFDINFVREFRDKINWTWLIYADGIEEREDIVKEFSLDDKLHEINHRVDELEE